MPDPKNIQSLPDPCYGEEIERVSRRISSSSFRAATEFKRASARMASLLSFKEFEIWAKLGLELGTVSNRAWECAAEYFKSSPVAMGIEVFAFIDLHQWVGHGKELAAVSPEAATSYFRHSPRFIQQIDLWSLEKWVKLGGGLLDGHWRSAQLVAAYFPASLECLPIFGLKGLNEWVAVAAKLSSRSHDAAQGFIENSPTWFAPLTEDEKTRVLKISEAMAASDYTSVLKFFPLLEQHQRKVKQEVRRLSYDTCLNISRHSPRDALTYMESCPAVLARVESKDQLHLMELGVRLSELSWEAALVYLDNLPEILTALPVHKVEPWFQVGLTVTEENEHAGAAYFAMESKRSQEEITRLQRTVHLEDVSRLLNLYAEGLTARKLKIKKMEETEGNGGTALPITDGEHIHLPPRVVEYEDYGRNFKWYKVATAHQAGYYEYGTFDFSIRSLVQRDLDEMPAGLREKVTASERNDLEGFFQLFRDIRLASTLFRTLEDGRVDYLLRSNYRGLKRDMQPILEQTMARRPRLKGLSLRSAALEMLLRITTLGEMDEEMDRAMETVCAFLTGEAQRVFSSEATVFDSAIAAARIYPLVKSLPPITGQRHEIIEARAAKLEGGSEEVTALLEMLLLDAEAEGGPEDLTDEEGLPLDILEFRGDTKPEEVQKLMKLRDIKDNIEKLNDHGVPLPLEFLKELLKMGVDIDITEMDDEMLENSTGLFVTNIDGLSEIPAYKKMKEMVEEDPEVLEQLLYGGVGLDDSEANAYYYDEWDFLIEDYRSKWCRLKELSPGEDDTRFVEDTLKENAELVTSIRRQFQLLRPEMYRKVKKLESGEEIDLDAAIEAITDKRCRISPSEKIYQRRDKRERDVATLFLVDVSASTDEEIEKESDALPSHHPSWQDDKYANPGYARGMGGPPPEPAESGKGKRIIDVEKEALVLMAEALEAIGDEYAIFCFSGYGRDNVEFFTVKEFRERYNDKIKSRIGAVKPQRSTRMGPAIRHAIKKLQEASSRLKILVLLSDGYPQDFDYGKDRTSRDYGIHDTAAALREAREKEIHPFLITVDPAGNEYLKEMCGEKEYMIIEKVSSLPEELLRTYRTLTYR
jgi:hypothetical protein